MFPLRSTSTQEIIPNSHPGDGAITGSSVRCKIARGAASRSARRRAVACVLAASLAFWAFGDCATSGSEINHKADFAIFIFRSRFAGRLAKAIRRVSQHSYGYSTQILIPRPEKRFMLGSGFYE